MDVNLKMSSFAHRPLSGPEKKYGHNEWETLELCPVCCCANPVKVVLKENEVELHCKKCIKLGSIKGSLIRTVTIDWTKDSINRIIDG
jgi:hypothetical protein